MISYLWKNWMGNHYPWWKKIIKFPRNFCKFIGELCSFLHNGFPYEAIYDHYWWFLKQTKAQFQRYLKNYLGYPGRDGARTNEEWENIVKHMIDLLDYIEESEYDYSTPFSSDYTEEMRVKAKDEFFDLYSKWFFDLWD